MGDEPITTVTGTMTSALSTVVTRKTPAREPDTTRDTRPSDPHRLLRTKTCAACAVCASSSRSYAFTMSFGAGARYPPPAQRPTP
jgi:hypothetical protein